MRDIRCVDYNGMSVRFLGTMIGDNSVFFHFSGGGGRCDYEAVYISAVEALLNGYDIAYIPHLYLSEAVEKAAHDTLKGSIFAFLPKGIESVSSRTLSLSLVTGGGAVSIVENDALYSFEALLGITYLASALTKATVMCFSRGRTLPSFVDSALGNGKSICVLRNALSSHILRKLVREGAPVVDSFSSFLTFPSFVAYPKEKGMYGTESRRWDIMRI